MTELLKSSYRVSIISSILFIIVGILLFVDPDGFVKSVSYLIGILLMVAGVGNVIKFAKNPQISISKAILTVGIILVIIGLFLILKPTFIGSIVPSVLGVCLIISSIEKLMYLKYLNDQNTESYITSMIFGIVVLIVGIFLLFNPFSTTLIITQIIGVIIIIYATTDLIEKIRFKKGFKKEKIKIKVID